MTTHTKTTKYTLNKKSERNCYHIKTFTYCTVNIKTSCKRSILICKIKQFKMVESTSNNTSATNKPAMFLLQQSKKECLVFYSCYMDTNIMIKRLNQNSNMQLIRFYKK